MFTIEIAATLSQLDKNRAMHDALDTTMADLAKVWGDVQVPDQDALLTLWAVALGGDK